MNRILTFYGLVFSLLLAGQLSGQEFDDSLIGKGSKSCLFKESINNQTICFDGYWVLSDGILGQDKIYYFVRERNFLILRPIFNADQRHDLVRRIDSRTLETESLETAFSIQGMINPRGLVFDQQNALVVWPETIRINLFWNGDFFSGNLARISSRGGNIPAKAVTLKRLSELGEDPSDLELEELEF